MPSPLESASYEKFAADSLSMRKTDCRFTFLLEPVLFLPSSAIGQSASASAALCVGFLGNGRQQRHLSISLKGIERLEMLSLLHLGLFVGDEPLEGLQFGVAAFHQGQAHGRLEGRRIAQQFQRPLDVGIDPLQEGTLPLLGQKGLRRLARGQPAVGPRPPVAIGFVGQPGSGVAFLEEAVPAVALSAMGSRPTSPGRWCRQSLRPWGSCLTRLRSNLEICRWSAASGPVAPNAKTLEEAPAELGCSSQSGLQSKCV